MADVVHKEPLSSDVKKWLFLVVWNKRVLKVCKSSVYTRKKKNKTRSQKLSLRDHMEKYLPKNPQICFWGCTEWTSLFTARGSGPGEKSLDFSLQMQSHTESFLPTLSSNNLCCSFSQFQIISLSLLWRVFVWHRVSFLCRVESDCLKCSQSVLKIT